MRLVVALSYGLLSLTGLAATAGQRLVLLLLGSGDHDVAVLDDEVVVVAQVELASSPSGVALVLAFHCESKVME